VDVAISPDQIWNGMTIDSTTAVHKRFLKSVFVFIAEKTKTAKMNDMPRKPLHHVTDPATWRTLCAPVRLEIVETLRLLAPCGIAAVAEHLDRPADTLYRHFRKLVETGVVLKTEIRQTGHRPEQIYDLIADDITCRFSRKGNAMAGEAVLMTAQSILKMTDRTFRAAADAGLLSTLDRGLPSDVRAFFEHAWLSPEDSERLMQLFGEIKQLLDDKRPKGDGRLCLVSVLMAPIVRKRPATPRKTEPNGHTATKTSRRSQRPTHSTANRR
jgi:predicted transcriptional regulator